MKQALLSTLLICLAPCAPTSVFGQAPAEVKSASDQSSAPLVTLLSIEPDSSISRASEGDIIKLSDGRLALVYSKFSGGDADHSPAHLALRTSADSGNTWTADRELVPNEGGRNVMSVSMIPSQDNGILLFYLRKDTDHSSCTMLVRRSYDDLTTLSDPVTVTTLPGYHVVNNDRVLRLKSGRLLVPSALHTDMQLDNMKFAPEAAMVVYYSDDDGKTWLKDNSPVPPLKDRKLVLQEPGLVELDDGTVLMYIRTGHGSQYVSRSTDAGHTWSPPEPTALASPRSPATIEKIPGTDQQVAVWNDHSGSHSSHGENRTPLSIALVSGDYQTTPTSVVLEGDPNGWYCYTSMTFTGDSLILSYCAGQGRKGGLNRLKVAKLPLEWVKQLPGTPPTP